MSIKLKIQNCRFSRVDNYDNVIFWLDEDVYKKLDAKFPGYEPNARCFQEFQYDGKTYRNLKFKPQRVYDGFHPKTKSVYDLWVSVFPWSYQGRTGVSAAIDFAELAADVKHKKSKDQYDDL